jgi:excisionase family DNA binding protein
VILTIPDAAALVGVSPRVIRSWVARGQLRPIRPGAHPLQFRERDLVACAAARMSRAEHGRLDTLWAQVVALCPSDV